MNLLSNIKKVFCRKVKSSLIPYTQSLIPYTLSLILVSLLLSCSDDLNYKSADKDIEGITLSICIPDLDMAAQYGATRSDEFQNTRAVSEAEEGTINSLWLFAYKDETNPDGAETKITQLSGHPTLTISSPTTGVNYKKYEVNNFHIGKYHIYLLANFDRYLPEGTSLSTNLKEDELNKLLLEFSTDKKLEKNYLPMYCLNTQIKDSSTGSPVNNGIFYINGTNEIYADMNFLCAKVRYTVLFDNTASGFSNHYASNDVNFKEQTIGNNLNPQVALDPEKAEVSKTDSWNSTEQIHKVSYPSSGSLYFNIGSLNNSLANSPNNLSQTDDWLNQSRRAWQGVAYFPENISTNKDDQSYISVDATENGEQKTYSFAPRILERGKMYDLVAKLKKSDFDVEVMISEWNQESLFYTLHGPYQLVVEYDQIELQSGKYFPVGYRTDTSISYDIPQIYCTNANGETGYFDFYKIEPITEEMVDEDGNYYTLTDNYDGYFRVSINPDLPFEVIWALMDENVSSYKDENGEEYTKESLSYFHIVAGNLHKKIDVSLDLQPFLNVYPQYISIDTREYYMSVTDSDEIVIRFFTNYDNRKWGIDLNMIDKYQLVEGKGEVDIHGNYDLKLNLGAGIDSESAYNDEYPIVVTEGEVRLKLSNLIGTHDFWKSKHEYKLNFVLEVRNPNTGESVSQWKIEKPVTIIIKPYVTTYIIHFKDGTNTWNDPVHTFIYQDLLLPSDLKKGNNNEGVEVDASSYAGKIVGYVEEDANNAGNKAYNASTEYVFSNNIAFRGWKGYGGPDLNNPYDIYEDYYIGSNAAKYDRQGFIMLGKPEDRSGTLGWVWNERYGYTNRNKLTDTDGQQLRTKIYRYDVNFNEDHERSIEAGGQGWQCGTCLTRYNNGSRYNSTGGGTDHDYDYPGIVMERETGENEGWWKYTLTGVASPGKTMIIFANSETPWSKGDQNDHRFPGDYDTGLPLFDFEDNEGWFIFNGKNTSNETKTQPHFFDEKEDALKAYEPSN